MMASKKIDRKKKYKFVMSRYVVERSLSAVSCTGWDYETQVQKLPAAKKIVDRMAGGLGDHFRVYDNVIDQVVYPKHHKGAQACK